jgi:hypothetical protein
MNKRLRSAAQRYKNEQKRLYSPFFKHNTFFSQITPGKKNKKKQTFFGAYFFF